MRWTVAVGLALLLCLGAASCIRWGYHLAGDQGVDRPADLGRDSPPDAPTDRLFLDRLLPDTRAPLADTPAKVPDTKVVLPDTKVVLPDTKATLPDARPPDTKGPALDLGGPTWVADSFTGPDLTQLSVHNPDVGQAGSWQSFNGRQLELSGNQLRAISKNQDSTYINVSPLPSSTYTVGITGLWDNVNNSNRVGLLARAQAGSSACYLLIVTGSGNYSLQVVDPGGSATQLQSGTVSLTLNIPHRLELRVSDAAKAFHFDGVPIASSTDNQITSAGSAGVLMSWFTTQTAAMGDDFAVGP